MKYCCVILQNTLKTKQNTRIGIIFFLWKQRNNEMSPLLTAMTLHRHPTYFFFLLLLSLSVLVLFSSSSISSSFSFSWLTCVLFSLPEREKKITNHKKISINVCCLYVRTVHTSTVATSIHVIFYVVDNIYIFAMVTVKGDTSTYSCLCRWHFSYRVQLTVLMTVRNCKKFT